MQAIVSINRNHIMGVDDALPIYSKEDLSWFKTYTMGKVIVGGRKTLEEVVGTLKGRKVVLVSRHNNEFLSSFYAKGWTTFNCLDLALFYAKNTSKQVVVIGGADVFKQTNKDISEYVITRWKDDDKYEGRKVTIFPKNLLNDFNKTVVVEYDDRYVEKWQRRKN